ncbi:MAG TPA: MaoC/PaaZ C-terminal domain-containing protein [Polyangiaceae bacterium]|nr:MaoC/PaaZ C-terminal domain-containing protein [Polyangiaceae bacterium]
MNIYRWNDLSLGMKAEFTTFVTATMMAEFRNLSGDTNPLHFDAAFAAAAGHPAPVGFGMLTAAFYSTLVGVHLPGAFAVLHGIDVDFHRPVYAGDRLTVSGEITFLSDAVRRVELSATIRDDSGRRMSRARIRVGVHEH